MRSAIHYWQSTSESVDEETFVGQRHTIMRQITFLAMFLAGAISFQNCSPVNFEKSSPSLGSNDPNNLVNGVPVIPPQNCSEELRQTAEGVRMLFVVDTSGSNQSNPGSDPQKTYRGSSLDKFIASYRDLLNFNWQFLTFSGTSTQQLINPGPFAPVAAMDSAMTTFRSIEDKGNTPYLVAISRAASVITQDTASPAATLYIVVFISDGLPNPNATDLELEQAITDLIHRKPGQISFNTVYYGPNDPQASQRLFKMSVAGHGQFLDTNLGGRDFPISNVVTIPGKSCQ